MHTGSIPVGPTMNNSSAAAQEATMRQPNPMDPLDGFKRWMEGLWPMQRVSVYSLAAAVVATLLLWATR